ncbi:DEAD/DEAH box helicase [Spirochaeta dissipatitropha]
MKPDNGLANSCMFKMQGQEYFIISGSPDEGSAFSIHTGSKRIDVHQSLLSRTNQTSGEKKIYYEACRIAPQKNLQPKAHFRLAMGKIIFSDKKVAVSEYTKQQLDEIRQTTGSYLQAWDEYAKVRGERVLERAREFGKHRYINRDRLQNGMDRFYFESTLPAVKKGDAVELVATEPLFLEDLALKWDEYVERKLKRKENTSMEETPESMQGKVHKIENNIMEVYFEGNKKISFNELPLLVLSTLGEETQLERQRTAWNKISNAESGIPHLGLLLEDRGKVPPQKPGKEVPMTASVYKKIFSNEPTQIQRDAIRIALSTPDIALIQGPPGTGKTTVITAILELLNVAHDKTTSSAGRVLASSYQHDAVINMIDRLNINSIPTYKFGNRSSAIEFQDNILSWISSVSDRVRQQNPNLVITPNEAAISTAAADYAQRPTLQKADFILSLLRGTADITSDLREAILDQKRILVLESSPDSASQDRTVRIIRSMRIDVESFLDDGPDRALDVYAALENDLKTEDRTLLKRAATVDLNNPGDITALIKELRYLKRRLLEQYTPRPQYAGHKRNDTILDLCRETVQCIQQRTAQATKIDRVLSDWLAELEYNMFGIQHDLKKYNYVYASTTQQSEGTEIRASKYDRNDKRWFLYDTVIIDEAARATPPDLLIPMCKAARRIILVGDHRQLPHMVEEEILSRMETPDTPSHENDVIDADPFRLSMFEHMFTRLKQLEAIDGISRTITLDAQFRSHPLLGKFASDYFYATHGEGYKSPRPEDDFGHSLPGTTGKPAMWVDVPMASGREERSPSGSLVRDPEVDKIVEMLADWMQSPQGAELSYGVISFYRAQVEAIRSHLKDRFDITESERLRIGTVDSFQGMEFDVVLLSVVRSNSRGNFGFLKSVNRLCVSMTRQKRLLAVVGDKEFCTSVAARKAEAVPALAAFADLCAQQGEIL